MCAAAVLARAQEGPPFPEEEVLVVVWKSAGRCSVLDRKTYCARVAGLLSGRLQVSRDRTIVVATEGIDEDVRLRAARVLADIRAAGFHRVRPAVIHR
jgi:hypothetical protein